MADSVSFAQGIFQLKEERKYQVLVQLLNTISVTKNLVSYLDSYFERVNTTTMASCPAS